MSETTGAPGGAEHVKGYFWWSKKHLRTVARAFVEDPEPVLAEAEAHFDRMLPDLAYVDRPAAPMASSLFLCTAALALWVALRERGVDVHAFGRAMVEQMATWEQPPGDQSAWLSAFKAAGEESQRARRPGEFVFEVIDDDPALDWGMNILSCAICHQFSKYDAMELVPYMCASDDVMSDRDGSGLRRTGTIGLGAHRCDFRYRAGGEPARLADSYPQQIRLAT
jgi:L-2-amino-thiazoline-4-carboxylic acid hydrolase-like protein